MWMKVFEYTQNKQKFIFTVLFVALMIWTIQNYEKRETEYIKHESEYHKIISDNTDVMRENTAVMKDNTAVMKEMQKTNEGFKMIVDVKLAQIEKILDNVIMKGR
jgi:uncharacterized protein YpmB